MRKFLIVFLIFLASCAGPMADNSCSSELPFAERLLRHAALTIEPNTETEGLPRLGRRAGEMPGENTVTWLGHSSFLLRMGGQVLLLDPVFVDDIHGWLPAGGRLAPQAPLVDRLTNVDAVIISHGHTDHANNTTLRELAARFPEAPIYAPSGLVPLLKRIGARRIRPVEHYAPVRFGRLTLTAVPVRHDQVLVAIDPPRDAMPSAWVIDDGVRKVYFAGDNAYSDLGKETRARLGAMSLALLPVGTFSPRELFRRAHESPQEASAFARDLGAPVAIGHHWGTYAWGAESPTEVRAQFLATAGPGFTPLIVDIGAPVPLPY